MTEFPWRPDPGSGGRIDWIDIAKGWCIVLVVGMHSALGVGYLTGETGWLHAVVVFAKPFRMPDFFLVAGLFASSVIGSKKRDFIDRKLIHFAYFYVLWVSIVVLIKGLPLISSAPGSLAVDYLWSLVQPYSTMWFIYILPLLFLTVRILHRVSKIVVLTGALALHIAAARYPDGGIYSMSSDMTGSIAIDSYALFVFYFLSGHYARKQIFQFADAVSRNAGTATAGVMCWALANQLGISTGATEIPGLTVLFGLAGALAVITVSVLLAKFDWMGWLAYCGRNSLVIYLAFVLPMGAMRTVLLKSGVISSVGWVSAVVAAAAIIVPLMLEKLVRNTSLQFLFVRPTWARLGAQRFTRPKP